ncbi:MAG: T9SS type A sorting domain-containing protein [Bacteroidetes bacterium]|nr:T9SS type A sorting domain-containing protein [Bacteroidota bacterium]MCL2302092.1 T9SS type A sorting domain-containing protein [Lentimicrobiaceae bacterium]
MKKQVKKSIILIGIIAMSILHLSAKENKELYISAENNLLRGYIIPIAESYIGKKIFLYADLENDKLTLNVNNLNAVSYHIIDANGKVYEKSIPKNKITRIDISDLQQGTYYLTVEKRNKTVLLFKIVKKTNAKKCTFANLF